MMLDKLKTMLFNNNVETLDNLEGVKLDILSGLEIIMEGLQDVHNAIYLFDPLLTKGFYLPGRIRQRRDAT